jgi:hypothetical protein
MDICARLSIWNTPIVSALRIIALRPISVGLMVAGCAQRSSLSATPRNPKAERNAWVSASIAAQREPGRRSTPRLVNKSTFLFEIL